MVTVDLLPLPVQEEVLALISDLDLVPGPCPASVSSLPQTDDFGIVCHSLDPHNPAFWNFDPSGYEQLKKEYRDQKIKEFFNRKRQKNVHITDTSLCLFD